MARSRARRSQRDLTLARELVDDLLLDPPETPDDVHEALSGVDRRALADVVLEVLMADRLEPFDDDMFTEVARGADKKRVVDRLLDVAVDQQMPAERRAVAWTIALHVDSKRANAQIASIEPEIAMASSQRGLRVMLMRLEMFPDEFAPVIRDTLLGLDEEHRELMWMTYEVARAQLGTPAGLVYRDVVDHPGLTSLAHQLDAVLDAVPDADAIRAVERALEHARRDDEQARLRKRLMQLRTAAAESPPPRSPAKAWATGCDGQGAFVLHVEIERPSGDVLGGQLCLRTSVRFARPGSRPEPTAWTTRASGLRWPRPSGRGCPSSQRLRQRWSCSLPIRRVAYPTRRCPASRSSACCIDRVICRPLRWRRSGRRRSPACRPFCKPRRAGRGTSTAATWRPSA